MKSIIIIVSFSDHDAKDGERLPLAIKDMGPCEMFPTTLSHNPNGRYLSYVLRVKRTTVFIHCCVPPAVFS